jgi:NAD(P)-dependent dehydrogenase (short-subunit alcohol dehydrogenase family)
MVPPPLLSVALRIGAASGIGQATAMLAARSGARGLVLADLAADGLSAVAAEAAAAGAKVETVTGSVARSPRRPAASIRPRPDNERHNAAGAPWCP